VWGAVASCLEIKINPRLSKTLNICKEARHTLQGARYPIAEDTMTAIVAKDNEPVTSVAINYGTRSPCDTTPPPTGECLVNTPSAGSLEPSPTGLSETSMILIGVFLGLLIFVLIGLAYALLIRYVWRRKRSREALRVAAYEREIERESREMVAQHEREEEKKRTHQAEQVRKRAEEVRKRAEALDWRARCERDVQNSAFLVSGLPLPPSSPCHYCPLQLLNEPYSVSGSRSIETCEHPLKHNLEKIYSLASQQEGAWFNTDQSE